MIDKTAIRKGILFRRDSIAAKDIKDEKIMARLLELPEFKAALTILFYASFKSEVETITLIKHCVSTGRKTVLPKVNDNKTDLLLYEIKDIAEIAPGYYGIPEPPAMPDRKMDVQNIDLIIVPGVAFDEKCNRLGYGKGFYDKLLKFKKSPAVALSYEEQIVPSLPSGPHDIKVDKIITDRRIIDCRE